MNIFNGKKALQSVDLDDILTPISSEQELKQCLSEKGVVVYDVAIPRSANIIAIDKAYKEVKKIITENSYNLVHCHSPIGSVVARLAAREMRKHGLQMIYTAHGFHFFSGAPIKNWLVFYPIEKFMSHYTDILLTINREDFERAKSRFNVKRIEYVPGIGIDTRRFTKNQVARQRIREELGISDNKLLLLSVGELNSNKNHEVVIRAIRGIDVTYVVVGKGVLRDELISIANEFNVDLRLVGYRSDVADFYSAADAYVLPSKREGLNVSLMEAMAAGLPVACGHIRGNVDLITEGKGGYFFDPFFVSSVNDGIAKLLNSDFRTLGKNNLQRISSFDKDTVTSIMAGIYASVTEESFDYETKNN
ncbi:MAG: glycosyltransferase [Saccharofermentans sp.]|nr:glycosyltransferase [Saccharofermentans sp.]